MSGTGYVRPSPGNVKVAFQTAISVADDAVNLQADSLVDCAANARKTASHLGDNLPMKLATLRADAIALRPDIPELLLDTMLDKVASYGNVPTNFRDLTPPSFVLSRDRAGALPLLDSTLHAYKEATGAGALVCAALEKVADLVDIIAEDDPNAYAMARRVARDVERVGKSAGFLNKEAAAAPKITTGPWPTAVPSTSNHGKDLSTAADDVEKALNEDAGPQNVVGPLLRTGVHGALTARQGIADTVFRDIPAGLRQFTRDGMVGGLLEETALKNKERVQGQLLDRETLARDTRSMATLQRLMAQDEILSTKDPEQVVEAYNTIRSASPEVAADPSLLRLMLRGALETQGVDIDSATASRKFEQGAARPQVAR